MKSYQGPWDGSLKVRTFIAASVTFEMDLSPC